MTHSKPEPNRYRFEVNLEPAKGTALVTAAVEWQWPEGAREAVFALHKSADILRLQCDPPVTWELRPGSPAQYAEEASTLVLRPKDGLALRSSLRIEMAYRLTLGIVQTWEVNRLTPEWVELGLYTPWFPFDVAYAPFEYIVEIGPIPGYQVTGSGTIQFSNKGWRLASAGPGNDCVIIAAPELRELREAELSVVHTRTSDGELASAILNDGKWVMERFGRWFGRHSGQLRIVLAPREKGGGYTRPGLVVLTPEKIEPERMFKWVGHETAHLWWWRADVTTWEDWLNESVAEYSALAAVRERYGSAAAEELIAAKREATAGLPPIFRLPRSHEKAYPVLYGKGCVLLWDLAARIGEAAMSRLLREMYLSGVNNTERFLCLLEEISGQPVAADFAAQLRA